MSTQCISIIVPCFNEEVNIKPLFNSLINVCEPLKSKYHFEVIFVDDGSTDNTLIEIEHLEKNEFMSVVIVEFSRNFGKELATSAGINSCNGDACIIVDADGQYPVEALPTFFEEWQNGYDVVIGIRDSKNTENIIEKIGSYFFYKLINATSEYSMVPGAIDFRLIDKKVIQEFKRFTERGRMTRALIDWLGFKKTYITYAEKPRSGGQSAFNIFNRIKLALATFISQSLFPLKVAGYLGVFVTLVSSTLLTFILLERYILNNALSLFISSFIILGLAILVLVGVILMSLGIISLYIANIHIEVTNRPLYVIRR